MTLKIETVTVKQFLRMADWPTDTKIKFLDQSESGLPNIYWKPLPRTYTTQIPNDQAEDILDIQQPMPTSILRNDWRIRLKPEVKEWCIASLEMNRAFPRRRALFNVDKDAETVEFYVEFECEKDALHFKLRWIG